MPSGLRVRVCVSIYTKTMKKTYCVNEKKCLEKIEIFRDIFNSILFDLVQQWSSFFYRHLLNIYVAYLLRFISIPGTFLYWCQLHTQAHNYRILWGWHWTRRGCIDIFFVFISISVIHLYIPGKIREKHILISKKQEKKWRFSCSSYLCWCWCWCCQESRERYFDNF